MGEMSSVSRNITPGNWEGNGLASPRRLEGRRPSQREMGGEPFMSSSEPQRGRGGRLRPGNFEPDTRQQVNTGMASNN